jgi:hypothetical protein
MATLSLSTAVVAMVSVGTGVAQAAAAPSVVGQKYSDAQTALSGAGFTPVVSSTVGDQQSWPDCVVVDQVPRVVAAQENTGGSATDQMLVSLNCDAAVASAKVPGNSLASPAGRAAAAAAKIVAAKPAPNQ